MRVHEDALNRNFFFLYLVTLRLFLQNKVGKIYLYFGAFLIKTLFHSRTLDIG